MKYGIVYYKDTANLGDDILTYAGTKFCHILIII